MPIGKDSITKRVAKVETPAEEKIAPELVATTAAAPKATAKKSTATKSTTTKSTAAKSTASTAKKTSSSTTKKAPARKPAAEKLTPPTDEPKVATNVLSNVAPETVEAVIGHKENTKFEKVQVGDKMPTYLL